MPGFLILWLIALYLCLRYYSVVVSHIENHPGTGNYCITETDKKKMLQQKPLMGTFLVNTDVIIINTSRKIIIKDLPQRLPTSLCPTQ